MSRANEPQLIRSEPLTGIPLVGDFVAERVFQGSGWLAGATGLEPDRGDISKLLMARDFRHKSLRMCRLVPVLDSPGVPSSPLESSPVLEK